LFVKTEDASLNKAQSNDKTSEVIKPRMAINPHDFQSEDERKALSDLRKEYIAKMLRVPRPSCYEKREEIENILIDFDTTFKFICKINNPEEREIALSAMKGAFNPLLEYDYHFQAFINYLTAYLREGVIVRILNEPTFSKSAPRITLQSLIIPGDKTKEGILVKGVSTLWFEMIRQIRINPDIIYRIECWKWEEMLAGAYKQDGWEIVTLTPKKGDKGIDIIAERTGLGKLRFLLLDQMKAYKPDHLVGPDEIREMKGVLLDHPEASKGLITTTANFSPGALEAVENLAPRLELRPKDRLVSWLASIIINEEE
jgi:restriction system protein